MPYKENDQVWWSVEEWASPEFMGQRRSYSKEMVRRYCRTNNLEALNAAAIRKRGGRWEIRQKPLTEQELRTEKAIGAVKRLSLVGADYDPRRGTWVWSPRAAKFISRAGPPG